VSSPPSDTPGMGGSRVAAEKGVTDAELRSGEAAGRAVEEVYLELGSSRVFACSLEWPGWCRSGRDEEQALAALAAYASRYAPVAAEVGLVFPLEATLDAVERLPGNATTDFGAPAVAAKADNRALARADAERLASLVEQSWRILDRVAQAAPASLRKGPRGGGRDRDAIVEHVAEAEAAYARKLGIRLQPASAESLRESIASALRASRVGEPLIDGGWLPRYAARRVAWHALDHAWEIEDRSVPAVADPARG
jgi:hypothetical protein